MQSRRRRSGRYGLVLAAISFLLAACQTASPTAESVAVPGASPAEPSASASAERGQELYRSNCTICHGDKGERGANPLATAVDQLDDAALAETILNGVPERGMPAQAKLTNEQVADVVAFIRSWNSD